MKKFRIKYAWVILIIISLVFVFEMPRAVADTFYETFISQCESEEWFISYINSKFIENGRRFSSLTSEDDPILLNITELRFPASGVNKIPKAVKYIKNLSYVDLSYNDITDISPLYENSKISVLNLEGNEIKTADFSSFTNVTVLKLAFNQFTALPDLKNNKQLQEIDFSGNNINRLSCLEGLSEIGYIDLSGNNITSGNELGSFAMRSYENAAYINLSYNKLTDVGFTANISGLKNLDVSYNFISQNISKIPSSVETLNIAYNGLTDSTSFGALTNLTSLDASGNKLLNIGEIQKCTKLKTLNLSSNRIEETVGLDWLTELTTLNLSHNSLADMPLHTLLKKLTLFDISYNNISNIALINRYTSLRYINASHNNISDFSGINAMSELVWADFGYNNIDTVYANLYLTVPKLNVLKLSGNNLSKEQLLNLFANGFSEIWLCDMDLTDKIPDMSAYADIWELYVNNSKLSQNDIDNLFKKTDYTGLGLGGIVNDDIIARLAEQYELLTLDLSGSDNLNSYIDDIAKLNVLVLNLSNCNLDEFSESLLEGSLTEIDFSGNALQHVSDSILRHAAINGISIDFSDNAILNDNLFYAYLRGNNFVFDGNYLEFNFGNELEINADDGQVSVGDKIDIYDLLSLTDIYTGVECQLPDRSYFTVEILNGNTDSVAIDPQTLTLTVNGSISALDSVTVKVSLLNSAREALYTEFSIYTDELPYYYAHVYDTDVVYGVEIGSTFDSIMEAFGLSEEFELKFWNKNGEEITSDSIAGTGSRIQIIKNGNIIFDRTLVVFGDCSGDGNINSTDYMMMKWHIFNKTLLEGIYFWAADTYENGVINSTDYMQVKWYIFNKGDIPQTRQSV